MSLEEFTCRWEFVTTLGFEWSVIRRRQPYRWTILLYSGCRVFALLGTAMAFASLDATDSINCRLWIIFLYLFTGMALSLSSALILLRVIAIWELKTPVIVVSIACLFTNIAFCIHSAITSRATWQPVLGFCAIQHTDDRRNYILASLAADFVLLHLMLFGLLRWRRAGASREGVWHLLYTQGLQWTAVVTLAEVPPTVFILLNLNDPWNLMFQVPGFIIPTIGATRLYRGLIDYDSLLEAQLSRSPRLPSYVRYRYHDHVLTPLHC
ncbi:hypothetical protein BV25DRAFT_1496938 [Artomyces pyxidatus]|uniref:Uncharacterized protein n=1 Tax=Artomyces pyxidatus TaxID=48021 RepID=A0ACB8TCG7_9AGAM|nr:hypothetical protein BV25DRAFT_1496938 [Artomyces pyxidatus]